MATIKDYKKYQKLASVCDGTFGKANGIRANTESVLLKVLNETTIRATFIMVVNFGNENQMRQMMPRFKNEALSVTESTLKKIKEKYEEGSDDKITLKINIDTTQPSVEYLSYQIYNPKRTAYYRLTMLVDVK